MAKRKKTRILNPLEKNISQMPPGLQVRIDQLLETGKKKEADQLIYRWAEKRSNRQNLQKRRNVQCRLGDKRFTVVQVGSDPADTFAARSFERAMEAAMPDRGSKVTVYAVCAPDANDARLQIGELRFESRVAVLRTFRKK